MLKRTCSTGFYEYSADVQYSFGLAIRLLLTGEEYLDLKSAAGMEDRATPPTVFQAQASWSALLSLPPELRESVYRHVLGDRSWHITEPKSWRLQTFCRALGDLSGFYFPFGNADALLQVSRQIRREALPLAYRRIAIHADDIDGATALLMAIGHIGRDNVTSFHFGWESYADTQLNWAEAKPEIVESVYLTWPRLHVPICVCLLKQCRRLISLSLVFNDSITTDMPSSEFQSDPGIKQVCSLRNIQSLTIVNPVGEELEDHTAAVEKVGWRFPPVTCTGS